MNVLFDNLDRNYIQYNDNRITVIIDTNNNLWFNSNQVATSLGYLDIKDAIHRHVDKSDIIQMRYIKTDAKITGHPYSLYLNEAGLYNLILSSKLKSAKKFKDWITKDVLPSIRKYGYYKLAKQYASEVNNLMKQLNYAVEENKKMKNELKKNKYPNGGVVYVIDYSNKKSNIYRIGMTGNMNKRKKLYDTHTSYKKEVVHIVKTDCPIRLETCVRAMLYAYRYKNNKDYYICDLSIIIKAFKECSKSIKCIDQNGGKIMIDDQILTLYKNIKSLRQKLNRIKKKYNLVV